MGNSGSLYSAAVKVEHFCVCRPTLTKMRISVFLKCFCGILLMMADMYEGTSALKYISQNCFIQISDGRPPLSAGVPLPFEGRLPLAGSVLEIAADSFTIKCFVSVLVRLFFFMVEHK